VNESQNHTIREKRCAACGEQFECYAGGCWCDSVPLSELTRARLLEQYADCLCPTCLRQQPSTECADRHV
jgi:cysteine-rich CWC protein